MSLYHLARDPLTGRPILVQVDPGLTREQMAHLAPGGLPEAELAGAVGLGVKPSINQGQPAAPAMPTYRPLGGAPENQRGASQVYQFLAGGPPQNAMRLNILQTPRNAGEDAEVIAVTLGLTFQGIANLAVPGLPLFPFDVFGTIEWGVGGASFSADVDWSSGTMLALPASYVKVTANAGAVPGAAGFNPVEVVLSASVAYGPPAASRLSSPARRTINVSNPATDLLGAGATSAVFKTPDWANSATILSATGTAPNFSLDFFSDPAGAATAGWQQTSRTNVSNLSECTFPIPPDGRFFSVTNGAAVPMNHVQVMFNLALGG